MDKFYLYAMDDGIDEALNGELDVENASRADLIELALAVKEIPRWDE